jgi:xanthine dehydrogenase small subunit
MLEFRLNDRLVHNASVQAEESLLSVLRNRIGLTGTKEGCASGDCGACTVVVLTESRTDGAAEVRMVNSCITPAYAVQQAHVITVEGLARRDQLHPVQRAMVAEHGSQCGFCTPGFVMSMVGHQLRAGALETLRACDRKDWVEAISGNLCRCTGYRSILAAARSVAEYTAETGVENALALIPAFSAGSKMSARSASHGAPSARYLRPGSESALQQLLADWSETTAPMFVAGATDLWLEVTQRYRQLGPLIDLSQVAELTTITSTPERVRIGAAMTHAGLASFFVPGGLRPCAAITELLARFGSPQIRARGTIGGNLANGSPIADWPPLLLALDAELEICNTRDERRRVPVAAFYRGYKQVDLQAGEYLRTIDIPEHERWSDLVAIKISKRHEDDISSVMGAFVLPRTAGRLVGVRIAFGGMAATPVRLPTVEQVLEGNALDALATDAAVAELRRTLHPIDDVRASAEYRLAMAESLLRKALHAAREGRLQTLTEELGA